MDSPGSKLGIVFSFISTCLEMRFESSVAILLLPGKFRCKSYFVGRICNCICCNVEAWSSQAIDVYHFNIYHHPQMVLDWIT